MEKYDYKIKKGDSMIKKLKNINLIPVYMFLFSIGGTYILIYGQEVPNDIVFISWILGSLICLCLMILEFARLTSKN